MQLTTQDIFFSVLRSSIWQSPLDVEIPEGYDWTPVIQMFQEQALVGLVCPTLMEIPTFHDYETLAEKEHWTDERKAQIEQLHDQLVFSFMGHVKMREKIQKTIVRVFNELERYGIKPILMKGESMVRFYPQRCQRGIGDIDILVPQDRYHEAVRILQTLSGDMGHEDSMERHYKIEYDGFTLEIHQRPIWCANSAHKNDFRKLSLKYADPDKAEMIQLQGKDIRVFPMQYNALFIFNHLLEHLRDGGVGFKQVIDWTLMLANLNISHDILQSEFKKSGLLRAWKVMGGIAVNNLGLPKEKFPLYDETLANKSQGEILAKLVYGGNFGWKLHQKGEDSSSRPVQVLKNMLFVIKDTRYLWTLFPSGALMSSWGIIKGSLMHHAGVEKGNRVFE